MNKFCSTKVIDLGSCAFRQPNAAFNRDGAGENSKRCSYVHGYKLTAKFWFECTSLDDKNWVVDFGGLGELKKILQNQFDHTLTIDKKDPLLPLFAELHEKGGCDLRIMDGVGIEKVAEWCFDAANTFIKNATNKRCWVSKVEVWEHQQNSAIFTE
jgi:6-pyruvoyltetrahydropterin/6-carboxytetrahydropterin synthase